MVAPKLTPEGFKVLYLARSNFGSAVEEGQQRPHYQGAEMSKYYRALRPYHFFYLLLKYVIKLALQRIVDQFYQISYFLYISLKIILIRQNINLTHLYSCQ